MPQLILASTSPRRRQILQSTGLSFHSIDSGIDESTIHQKTPGALVRALARAKANAIAERFPNAVVIGGDTIVVCNKKVLGKPHTKENAEKMLKFISNKTITVQSAITIIRYNTPKTSAHSVKAKIKLRKLTKKEIRAYVKTKEPLDKAAAFAIQGRGAFFVNKVHGDYSAIIGLPLPILVRELPLFGIKIK